MIAWALKIFGDKKVYTVAIGVAVVLALSGLALFQEYRVRMLQQVNEALARENGEVIAANAGLAQVVAELEAEKARAEAALAQREAAHSANTKELQAIRARLAEALKADPSYGAWAGAPLPAPVLGLLAGGADGGAGGDNQTDPAGHIDAAHPGARLDW